MSELITRYYTNGNKSREFYVDENARKLGEYKAWYKNGQLMTHCFYRHGYSHGEFKQWLHNGELEVHDFDINVTDPKTGDDVYIKDKIQEMVQDINNITEEERMLIKLTWGIECLN